ncbi:hypothetical protein KIN_24680 [Litoreibacter roseus]|uniref:Uncharacterized protein n=1 Tax=Litoreibacter roseus TaxID=2601869 RepID=A0A6N6JGZ6_9RHOB|nr:hypothetical protein KIN_24680 [Litoreibacter roseus]
MSPVVSYIPNGPTMPRMEDTTIQEATTGAGRMDLKNSLAIGITNKQRVIHE